MPLIPKTEPPYYNIDETLPTPPGGEGNNRIYSDLTTSTTSGATEQTLWEFTVEANTIISTGDGIVIKTLTDNVDLVIHYIRLYINNTLVITSGFTTNGLILINLEINKIASTSNLTTLAMTSTYGGAASNITSTIDWTTDITFKITAESATGTVTKISLTADKFIQNV